MIQDDILVSALFFIIVAGMILFCAIIIKRYLIDKKYPSAGRQNVGAAILADYMSKDKQKAIQEVHYSQEEEENEADEGDDITRFSKKSKRRNK